MTLIYEKAKRIRCLILDLDGVLTDAGIYLDDQGRESRRFNINDGLGIKLLRQLGFEVAVITGSSDQIVAKRMQHLGIKHFYTKALFKQEPFDDLKQKLNIHNDEIAFMGDDYQDLVLFKQVGLSISPANAIEYVRGKADMVTDAKGGHGAVREVCEFFIGLHHKLDDVVKYFENYPCYSLEKVF
jgi:3-deoxy-D-manno-octulosonate 8-phosphate phosphatase (KDO 8-P phosphatase)